MTSSITFDFTFRVCNVSVVVNLLPFTRVQYTGANYNANVHDASVLMSINKSMKSKMIMLLVVILLLTMLLRVVNRVVVMTNSFVIVIAKE